MNKKKDIILNTDTNLLKLIAVITMLIDHLGAIIFPSVIILRIIGRISFPLFAYSTFIGYFKTKDLKKYLLRIIILALITQPIYMLAFNINYLSLNVMFSLFSELIIIYLIDKKKWWYIPLVLISMIILKVEYTGHLLFLIPIFYYCKNNKLLFSLSMITFYYNFFAYNSLYTVPTSVAGYGLLSLPLILIKTNSKIKINKWFYYLFYPLHLLILFIIKCMISS